MLVPLASFSPAVSTSFRSEKILPFVTAVTPLGLFPVDVNSVEGLNSW